MLDDGACLVPDRTRWPARGRCSKFSADCLQPSISPRYLTFSKIRWHLGRHISPLLVNATVTPTRLKQSWGEMEALHQDRGLVVYIAKHCTDDVTDVWNIHAQVRPLIRRQPLFTRKTMENSTQIYYEYGQDILSKSHYASVWHNTRVGEVAKIGPDVASMGREAALPSSTSREIIAQCAWPEWRNALHPLKNRRISALSRKVLSVRS